MRLLDMECRDFRCLETLRFAPSPGVNVVRGANAQGKTSILEAILFATTTKSHRTGNDAELARHGTEQFHVRLRGERREREVAIEAHYWQGAKRFKINGVAQTRLSDILGKINVVFFCPEDVDLVRGGAGMRRRFLDMELSQLSPSYLAALQRYRQVLRQRNELLRGPRPDPALLDAWDVQLVREGAQLVAERQDFVAALSERAAGAYTGIARAEPLRLEYEPDAGDADTLRTALERSREADARRGLTSRGPHRDEVRVFVGDRSARQFGSQGQQKTAALAVKLAEAALVKERTGEYPVLMLDEVLAELDAVRARRLFEAIGPGMQTIVTTTELEHRAGRFGAETTGFRIERGRIEKE